MFDKFGSTQRRYQVLLADSNESSWFVLSDGKGLEAQGAAVKV